MNTKVVLVTLSGQGDTERFFIPESVYAWAQSITPGDYKFPAELVGTLSPFKSEFTENWDDNINEKQYATSGSYDNDVMLFLSCLTKHYDTAREAIAAAATNQWELADEYDGCIY